MITNVSDLNKRKKADLVDGSAYERTHELYADEYYSDMYFPCWGPRNVSSKTGCHKNFLLKTITIIEEPEFSILK